MERQHVVPLESSMPTRASATSILTWHLHIVTVVGEDIFFQARYPYIAHEHSRYYHTLGSEDVLAPM